VGAIIKNILRIFRNVAARSILYLPDRLRFVDYLISIKMRNLIKVIHKSQSMVFVGANELCVYRAESFSNKEPDTLEWVEEIPKDSILWDVGANIGLYSIYAAKQCGCRVFAFEPSVFNLEILARNIYANQLEDLITIVPLALSEQVETNLFRMTSTNWGGALSTFSKDVNQHGKEISTVFKYRTTGVTMDTAVLHLGIAQPNFIKIDVDGIEHFVLKGGIEVLKKVEGVLIEIDTDFTEQAERSSEYLTNAGFTLLRKRHMIGGQFNQWWTRNARASI
jgi:FkbM family methyltransferase